MSEPEGAAQVEINGEPQTVSQGSTVRSLLADLGLDPRAVAVEYNGEILSRRDYQGTTLASGDRLEIVRFVQGGDDLEF